MIAAIYDSETTGLDPAVDRIVQHAVVIYDVYLKKTIDYRSWLCYSPTMKVAEEKTHGWSLEILKRHGKDPLHVLRDIALFTKQYKPRMVIAHNGISFDRPMLNGELEKTEKEFFEKTPSEGFDPVGLDLVDLPWIDSMIHKKYESPSRGLITLAAVHGFLNPFPHNALFDCVTVAKVIENYDIFEYVTNAAQTKYLVCAGDIPVKYDYKITPALNEKLKKVGFKFQGIDGHHVEKTWIQVVNKVGFEKLKKDCEGLCTVNMLKEIFATDNVVQLFADMKHNDNIFRELKRLKNQMILGGKNES